MKLRTLDAFPHEYAQGNDACQLILRPHNQGTLDRNRSNRNRIIWKRHLSSLIVHPFLLNRYRQILRILSIASWYFYASAACLFFFLACHRSHLRNRIRRKIFYDLHEVHFRQSCRPLKKQRHRAGRFNPRVIVANFL